MYVCEHVCIKDGHKENVCIHSFTCSTNLVFMLLSYPHTPKDHLLLYQERLLSDMVRWNKDHLDDGGQQERSAGGPISWPRAERGEHHKK